MASAEPEHAGAHVRHVGQFEQALHGAVLAERPVQQRHDHGACPPDGVMAAVGSIAAPVGVEPAGQRLGPCCECVDGTRGQGPAAVAADADRCDAVLRRVGRTQHVGGGGAAHVVLGRLAAEQHDEVDALVGISCGPDGTVCGSMRFEAM